jgi:hypothetical protein
MPWSQNNIKPSQKLKYSAFQKTYSIFHIFASEGTVKMFSNIEGWYCACLQYRTWISQAQISARGVMYNIFDILEFLLQCIKLIHQETRE